MLETWLMVLNDSDATCGGCGCDPRMTPATEAAFLVEDTGWYVDIIQTPDGMIAEVLCPSCFAGISR